MKKRENTLVFYVSKTEYQGRSVHYVIRSNISSSWEYDIVLHEDPFRIPEAREEVVGRIARFLNKGMVEDRRPYIEIKFNQGFRIELSSSSRELFLPITEEDARLFFDAVDHKLVRG